MVMVDVGANTGLYAGHAAEAGARVIAFEPFEYLARKLLSRLPAPHTIFALAVGTVEGLATIYVPQHDGRNVLTRASLIADANGDVPLAEYTVTVVGLDRLVDHADLLKVDVEGRELDVLRSGAKLLESSRPIVVVEVEQRHHGRAEAQEVFDHLAAMGYQGFFVRNVAPQPSLHPLSEFDFDADQGIDSAKPIGGDAEGTYINNFIFVQPDAVDTLRAAAARAFTEFRDA
jgi:FkbM family methyltransferase